MKIALCLLLSLAVGSGLYTAAAIGWSLLDPQVTGRTLLFTIPIAIVVTAGLGLLAAAVMMLPPGPPAKTRTARGRRSRVPDREPDRYHGECGTRVAPVARGAAALPGRPVAHRGRSAVRRRPEIQAGRPLPAVQQQ